MGTCGLAAGAEETLAAIEAELARRGLQRRDQPGRLRGHVLLRADDRAAGPRTAARMNYGQATAENVPEIFAAYFDGAPLTNAVVVGEVVPDATVHAGTCSTRSASSTRKQHDRIPFQQKQLRIVLSNCGLIDPESHRRLPGAWTATRPSRRRWLR